MNSLAKGSRIWGTETTLHENDNHLSYARSMIELRGVSVDHGRIGALRGVSAVFAAGEVTALAGPNGSGKSTLLGVIAGLQDHRGRVVSPRGTRVAYVVQRSAVDASLPLTVLDAVTMGRWARRGTWRPLSRDDRRIVAECVHAVGLDGLERRPLHELSGGQRQRALVAQGLAQRADVLLLDEPTVGLDDASRGLIGRAVDAEASRGVVVVHATHDDEVLRASARVIRLLDGRIVPERSTVSAY